MFLIFLFFQNVLAFLDFFKLFKSLKLLKIEALRLVVNFNFYIMSFVNDGGALAIWIY